MQVKSIVGQKKGQIQGFLENGTRVPLSILSIAGNIITQVKSNDKEGYMAIQVGIGTRKKLNKPLSGHVKKAGVEKFPRFFRELKVDDVTDAKVGTELNATEILKPGDLVRVTGTSKGKGYAGVVKRWGFRGGPRTHGQSDRERAPGSIGQTTTPGRVYKGKKMAGRMGNDQVTLRNLVVMDVDNTTVSIKGLVPGPIGSIVKIEKTGENKKFTPLFKKEDALKVSEEIVADEEIISTPEDIVETASDIVSEAPVIEETTKEEIVKAPVEEVKEEVKDAESK